MLEYRCCTGLRKMLKGSVGFPEGSIYPTTMYLGFVLLRLFGHGSKSKEDLVRYKLKGSMLPSGTWTPRLCEGCSRLCNRARVWI